MEKEDSVEEIDTESIQHPFESLQVGDPTNPTQKQEVHLFEALDQ